MAYDEYTGRLIEEVTLLRRALERTNLLAARMTLEQLRDRYGEKPKATL